MRMPASATREPVRSTPEWNASARTERLPVAAATASSMETRAAFAAIEIPATRTFGCTIRGARLAYQRFPRAIGTLQSLPVVLRLPVRDVVPALPRLLG